MEAVQKSYDEIVDLPCVGRVTTLLLKFNRVGTRAKTIADGGIR
jgi:hypothetical protein